MVVMDVKWKVSQATNISRTKQTSTWNLFDPLDIQRPELFIFYQTQKSNKVY